jgi:hypothetical protein
LYGTFDCEALKLKELLSIDWEGKLIEMSYQIQLLFSNQTTIDYRQPSASTSPFYVTQTNPSTSNFF